MAKSFARFLADPVSLPLLPNIRDNPFTTSLNDSDPLKEESAAAEDGDTESLKIPSPDANKDSSSGNVAFAEAVKDGVLHTELAHDVMNLGLSTVKEAKALQGIFKDPERTKREKLRGVLNYWVTPGTQVQWVTDEADHRYTLDLYRLPNRRPASMSDLSVPYRMIDLDTRKMVEIGGGGGLADDDQYCMLSHSWKGTEVNLDWFREAQRTAKDGMSDVQAIMDYCDADVEKRQAAVGDFVETSQLAESLASLLLRYVHATMAEARVTAAQKDHGEACVAVNMGQEEKTRYLSLIESFDQGWQPTALDEQIQTAESRRDDAVGELREAKEGFEPYEEFLEAVRTNRPWHYAIEDLIEALQRRRSSRKIQQSVQRALEIFNERPFLPSGKRYIWLDTCCIRKSDQGELTDSLARMGEWYANADFCLVHLDTPKDNHDWVNELYLWQTNKGQEEDQPTECEKPCHKKPSPHEHFDALDAFQHIAEWEPTWSTRGWTLQELVLSKMVYFVDASWRILPRQVDCLGRYYALCPFIEIYLRNQIRPCLHDLLAWIDKSIQDEELQAHLYSQEPQVSLARLIINALDRLTFPVPRQLNKNTARIRIGQAVRDIVIKLHKEDSKGSQAYALYGILRRLVEENLGAPLEAQTEEAQIKQVIDLLLMSLVALVKVAIQQDRHDISRFSKIQCLTSWSEGVSRDDFSTHSIMKLAAERHVTVPTDRAYSLMGILGVRFPVFPAEGLEKALSRLLDEVVINSSDVSLYNWCGKHNASPIRGRSLYPSCIEAYSVEDRSKKPDNVDREIVRHFQHRRTKDLQQAGEIIDLLREATAYVRSADHGDLLARIGNLVEFVEKKTYEELKSCFRPGDLVTRLQAANAYLNHRQDEVPISQDAGDKMDDNQEPENEESPEVELESGPTSPSSVQPQSTSPFLAFSPSREEQEREDYETRRRADMKAVSGAIQEILEQATNTMGAQSEPGEEEIATLAVENNLPSNTTTEMPIDQRVVCPNPIVVNSSGIEGTFDIQRVVITMLEPKDLWLKIKSASEHERIDGWCTISTGFAVTMVAFSCEREILKQQLKVVSVIQNTVIAEPHREGVETMMAAVSDRKDPRLSLNRANSDLTSTQGESLTKSYGNSLEQRKVSRMIDFVTESDLHLVAGEWVLARFSGAVGAKWFLARLELGHGRAFYARRIACDEFNFSMALPEKGLVEFWHTYLRAKKKIMCQVLSFTLDAHRSGRITDWLANRQDEENDDDQSDDGESDDDQGFKEKTEQYKKLGGFSKFMRQCAYGVRGFALETWAEHLERHLKDKALKDVPVRLQAAILALQSKEDLLPTMFHSGQAVHFF
ncbi:hypothetical protein BO82DRAFT_336366 [Aspergillus uvarum CBS 121591]|uniref:Heterokaryon incompatibility domain-containing protein n=1 Tax=Aspergillus uvarum CBS 121591 TaxID=1448315 RepID=A0A319CB02_9EURO|nr:hypothetical protein BO82DRAFT_336366 [Aspergillus uvarum CBS 121591]PYH81279.1 hypothetical protein BO82DRAFT_336366 [Aspergillus uvarum CBS 121591]